MAVNSITFGGVNSADYGIYISGEGVFNAPKRDVEMVTIPGRNGAFALDHGRFENIEVTYPAFNFEPDDYETFAQNLADFRNAICSQRGYQRLTDTFHPDEYRMATYIGGLEIKPIKYNTASEFTITFDCKPQRWLTSGEVPVTIGEYAEPVGTDNAPYLFRSSPQFSDGYDTEMDKLVGGTVAWNQLLPDFDTNAWATNQYATISNGEVAVAPTSTWVGTQTHNDVSVVSGHKYYISVVGRLASSGTNVEIGTGLIGNTTSVGVLTTTTNTTLSNIVSVTNSGAGHLNLANRNGVANYYMSKPQLIDLTQMFGSTIADCIYSLETATAGAGVAWFKKLFNKPYYAYNAGELKSVSGLVSHDMTGFNQWDEEWESGNINNQGQSEASSNWIRSKNYFEVVPNTGYCFTAKDADIVYAFWYDADKNFISLSTIYVNYDYSTATSPQNAVFCKIKRWVVTEDKRQTCVNITWDGSRNGEYEPYVKHSYALDDSLTLRGVPKLDSSNNLYYDGDTYESDGTVTRKYKVWTPTTVTLSKDTYYSELTGVACFFFGIPSDAKGYGTWTTTQAIADKLEVRAFSNSARNCIFNNTSIQAFMYASSSADTTVEQAQVVVRGLTFVYELATPTTESADAYQNPQIVNDFGTEEYVSTSIVPVGHNTKYGQNPNVIINPTLFEAGPLLEVEGYGTIEFNGYEIELENALMGSLTLLNQGVYSTGIRNSKYILTFNDNQFNTGDNITVNGLVAAVDHVNGYSYEGGVYKSTQINSLSLVSDSLTGANTSIVDLAPTSTSKSYKISTAFPDFTFTVGTASQIKNRALFSGTATVDNQSRTFSDQILEASISYDGSGTIEFYLTSWATGGRVYLNFLTNVYGTFETTGVIGESTLSLLGNPTYIDCDLGEAYLINGGVPVSLNAYIGLGSDLPKLASGENEVTFDNTITDLQIVPRWWKI